MSKTSPWSRGTLRTSRRHLFARARIALYLTTTVLLLSLYSYIASINAPTTRTPQIHAKTIEIGDANPTSRAQRVYGRAETSEATCFKIVVLAMNREECLANLLESLQHTDYLGDCVEMYIHIDWCEAQQAVIKLAKDFEFSHGRKEYILSDHPKGLARSWFTAWRPRSDSERAIILEDDIILSQHWYKWLKSAWAEYSEREDMAGISLQRQTLVPRKPHSFDLDVPTDGPFLYKLVGSIGFSPNPVYWKVFLRLTESVELETYDVSTPGLVTSEWWNSLDKKHIWTQHFIYFSLLLDLYTLYLRLPDQKTLAAHLRAKGAHFEVNEGADFHTASAVPMKFPHVLEKYGWDGLTDAQRPEDVLEMTMIHNARHISDKIGFVYVMFLNAAFSEMTKSWICNMRRVAESVLEHTIFISSDIQTTRKMMSFKPNLKIFTRTSELKEAVSFGSYAYYSVVLERLVLQNKLLQEGINIQIIEADQFWKRDITSVLQSSFSAHDIVAGQEGPFPQTTETVSRICGGFQGFVSTNRTRPFFDSYIRKYSKTLEDRQVERATKTLNGHEDDQAALTRLALEAGFHIEYLDRCAYANGLWFQEKGYAEYCKIPTVIHNGYIVGNDAKVLRAKQTGHWYITDEGDRCLS